MREVEGPDEALRDARAFEEGERRVAGNRLETFAVLEPSELRRESAAAQGHEALLEERLAL